MPSKNVEETGASEGKSFFKMYGRKGKKEKLDHQERAGAKARSCKHVPVPPVRVEIPRSRSKSFS